MNGLINLHQLKEVLAYHRWLEVGGTPEENWYWAEAHLALILEFNWRAWRLNV